jgi:hypothetical protein
MCTSVVMILIMVLSLYLIFTASQREGIYRTVYTMTPHRRLATQSDIAQMWWQPVAYIQNSCMACQL